MLPVNGNRVALRLRFAQIGRLCFRYGDFARAMPHGTRLIELDAGEARRESRRGAQDYL